MLKRLALAISLTALTGCGVAYISPKVSDAGDDVRVLKLTADSVRVANGAPYRPKELPAVFFANAGSGGGMSAGGGGPAPSIDRQNRPANMEIRLLPEVNPGPYEIGVGDVLLLATKTAGNNTVEELSGLLAAQNARQGYTVQDDGAIAIPDVGRVRLAGLTLEEAEAMLFQRLVENQIDPTFSLEIAEFNSKRVSLGGAVGNPTVVPVGLTPLTLDAALAAAGGIATSDLDYASIRIYRDGTLYQIPLNEYLSRPNVQKSRLVDGDSVFVDTEYELARAQAYFEEQIRLAEFRQGARVQALNALNSEVTLRRNALDESRDNFRAQMEMDAVDRDYVYMTGEFRTPSRFALPFGREASLADAMFETGGYTTEKANPNQLYVLRGSPEPGRPDLVTAWHLDASNASNMILATRMQLRPNDVVFIAEQPITRWNRALQQFVPSLITSGAALSQ
ncbi:polysaccharide biosynthesis/export family protein [Roseovarius nanhaiticus]|uniref:Polysaccharide export outer membrane protein n=1 Tax=Roseovarius nanhaiticus TaxID=573024 RepID=A0A1N7HG62_9RHOB|nr:polysaccharide biosynthesis/export family protein [Roseovarius nanhaiticus]SEK96328.1 polysaccharide export outer membrane protein [Roseovarius nanhaiticus]SIS23884.1 polysaccharide export outer membrane protein [Roseovarius nanhaiticus]